MEEKWKTIEWNPDYQVSNLGRVKSLKYGKERILKPGKSSNGYLAVNLLKKNKTKSITVHRLVCEAFLQNPYNLSDINHRNEIKTDNRLENLEYCDRRYNVNYGKGNERRSKTLINDKKKSKPVMCIETGKIYPSTMEVQRQFGFSQSNICACCRGERKIAYKFHWKWA